MVAANLIFPALLLELVLAIPVFMIARRRKVSAIRWTLLNFVPLIGWIFSIAFYAATVLSILNRLNRLETERSFD
jgi:hypothetical protein